MDKRTPRPMTEAEQVLLSDPPAERLADGDADAQGEPPEPNP